jgi:chaperonin GroEL
MKDNLIFEEEARDILFKGIEKLYRVISKTLGPKGRNVIIENKYGKPIVTKDGYNVTKHFFLNDPLENMGAEIAKEAAENTVHHAGDGTTTSTVLAYALVSLGINVLKENPDLNQIELIRWMKGCIDQVVEDLTAKKSVIEGQARLEQVIYISSNRDIEIVEALMHCFDKVGTDGLIHIDKSYSQDTTHVEISAGYTYDKGFMTEYYITDGSRLVADYENPLILITDEVINHPHQIEKWIEFSVAHGRPFVLIASKVDNQTQGFLVQNKMKAKLPIVSIFPPKFGDARLEELEDIAYYTGGVFMSKKVGRDISADYNTEEEILDVFGTCNRIIISRDNTVMIGGAGKKVDERITALNLAQDNADNKFHKEQLKARISQLTNAVATIHVGGPNEIELQERMDRYEDALGAANASLDGGYLPGGGKSLLYASLNLKMEINDDSYTKKEAQAALSIVKESLKYPITSILHNIGFSKEQIKEVITSLEGRPFNEGFNALSLDYEDFTKSGIIDPARVIIKSLENAFNVASLILTSDSIIALNEDERNHN